MKKMDATAQLRPKRGLIVTVLIAALALVFAGLSPALAAPPYASTGKIDTVKFTNSTNTAGSSAQMSATWSFTDNPSTPAGFTIALPPELAGRGDTFKLKAQDTGAEIGTCVAKATQLECDLLDSYVKANPRSLKGDVNFWVTLKDTVTTTTEKTYVVGGVQVTTTVVPRTRPCTENCNWEWKYQKRGNIDYANNVINWYVRIASNHGGMMGGEKISVTDLPDSNQSLILEPSQVFLQATNVTGPSGPTGWVNKTLGTDFTVAADGTVNFQAEAGYYYQVVYRTSMKNVGDVEYYANKATVTKNGVVDSQVEGSVRYAGGSGSGIGTDVGVFSITKEVTGATTGLPSDQVFTGTFSVKDPTGKVTNGNWSVKAGETFRSDEFPRDSTVTFTEDAVTSPGNIKWDAGSFSANNVTLPGGQVSPVTVTNNATVKTANFEASKSIEGTEAAKALVPADATFTLNYSYPAGVGFAAGNGSLVLKADGTAVKNGQLPVGAVLTLTEAAPGAVEGAAWGTAVITPSTLTIAEGTTVSVKLTNPISETLGGFTLSKKVSGEAGELVPAGSKFSVNYSWVKDDLSGSGTVDVIAGGEKARVTGIPEGAKVTLTEAAPSPVTGVKWLDPVFSENGFVVVAGTDIAIDLDNPTSLQTGQIAIKKVIDGSGADLVPATAEFTVDYSYPAGTGFEAGQGSLKVKADGTVVTSDPLPFGAVVTFKEATPAPVEGGTWGEMKFSESTVTVGDNTVTEVTLTNTITKNPPPSVPPTTAPPTTAPPLVSETPSPSAPTATPTLPNTGASDIAIGTSVAAFLMLLGAVVVVGANRRKKQGSH